MAIVRLPDPKRKTLGEKGIDCIFVGYAEHSKAYRFYVIEPNDYVSINTVIESRDAIFDENRFSLIPRPKDIIPNSDESQMDDHSNDVPRKTPEPCKEAIDDEIGSIMENNTWVLSDLPPGCKPLGYKWIFKMKMKVDGTIDKFKARLVIQGFRQKEGIDYFNTYATVARIATIKLLLALAAIHNLVAHQMDVKTTFLNDDLEEEVYMKQPKGFVMPVGRLSRFTSNPSRQYLHAITRVFKYLKGTMNYGLSYVGYPLVLEAYSDASWINHVEDSSSTSGWVFLLGRCAISWASKKQTCIIGSTIEYEFVALAVAGKEA
ncbi:zinc finger, CCHC-type containing protein [Tanacetum coccineum]